MANSTQPTDDDVSAFLDAVSDERRRADAQVMRSMMERITGEPAVMWGPSIVGFGSRPYTTTAGTSDWMILGFSPRKVALTLYGVHSEYDEPDALLAELGPHKTGKGCLYLKSLATVDARVLETLIRNAWERGV